mgnify:CR=1 FL=1
MALIEEDLILLDTQATDRNDALSQVAEHLHKDGFVKASYREAIINRCLLYTSPSPRDS